LLQFLLSGTFIEPNTIDIPKWAAILAETGYDNKDGWATLMTQLRANVSKLSPSEVEALIPALNSVGRYEKDLFLQMAEIVKVRDSLCFFVGSCTG
jgi:hypothetical protein